MVTVNLLQVSQVLKEAMKAPTEHVQLFHKYDALITREVTCHNAACRIL